MTPDLAPAVETKTYVPTKKWFAALVGGVALIVVHTFASGGFDETEAGELGTLASALILAYIKKNDATLEGKPPA